MLTPFPGPLGLASCCSPSQGGLVCTSCVVGPAQACLQPPSPFPGPLGPACSPLPPSWACFMLTPFPGLLGLASCSSPSQYHVGVHCAPHSWAWLWAHVVPSGLLGRAVLPPFSHVGMDVFPAGPLSSLSTRRYFFICFYQGRWSRSTGKFPGEDLFFCLVLSF